MREAVGADVPADKVRDMVLLTSELVANAIRHVDPALGDTVGVSVIRGDDSVTVTVSDPGPGFDAARRQPPSDESGWGLVLVDTIASRWDVVRSDDGTEVSFEIEWT